MAEKRPPGAPGTGPRPDHRRDAADAGRRRGPERPARRRGPPREALATGAGGFRTPAGALMAAAALVVVVAGMRAGQSIIVPFLLSVFLAVISAPPLLWLEERRLPRPLAMLVVIAGIIAFALGLTALAGPSVSAFTRDIPVYQAKLDARIDHLFAWLAARGLTLTRETVLGHADPGAVIRLAGDLFNSFGSLFANAFLIFLGVVLILFEATSLSSKLHAIAGDPERSLTRFRHFTGNLRRYLAIKTLASLGTGLGVALWLGLLGVDHPILWGLLAFFLNYVPNIGSIIAAVPALLLALVQLGPATAGAAAAGYLVVNVLIGNVVEPRFMGRGLGLSTLVVFLSLVFWGWVLGPVGMFLSVPLTMTAKIACESRADTRWIAILLGPGGPPGERGAPAPGPSPGEGRRRGVRRGAHRKQGAPST